jgi:hypothetical protein
VKDSSLDDIVYITMSSHEESKVTGKDKTQDEPPNIKQKVLPSDVIGSPSERGNIPG